MTITMPSPSLVVKSTEYFCQSLVPVGSAAELAIPRSYLASTMVTTGVLALLSLSVRA